MTNEKDKSKNGNCNLVHPAGDTSCKKNHAAAPGDSADQSAPPQKSSDFVTDPGYRPAEERPGVFSASSQATMGSRGKDGVATSPRK